MCRDNLPLRRLIMSSCVPALRPSATWHCICLPFQLLWVIRHPVHKVTATDWITPGTAPAKFITRTLTMKLWIIGTAGCVLGEGLSKDDLMHRSVRFMAVIIKLQ